MAWLNISRADLIKQIQSKFCVKFQLGLLLNAKRLSIITKWISKKD